MGSRRLREFQGTGNTAGLLVKDVSGVVGEGLPLLTIRCNVLGNIHSNLSIIPAAIFRTIFNRGGGD